MADTGSLFSQEGFISGEAIHERIEDVHESADERVVGLLDDEDDLTSNTEELLKQLDDAITTVDDTRAAGSILSSPVKKVAACRSEQGVNVVTPGKLTPAKRATPASNIGILEFPSQQQQMPPQCQQQQQVLLAFRHGRRCGQRRGRQMAARAAVRAPARTAVRAAARAPARAKLFFLCIS